MIIGRRHIILAALVVALAAAIFLNYKFSQPNDMVADTKTGTTSIGETAQVGTQSVKGTSSDFFATARLTRSQNRDQAEQLLKSVADDSSATTSDRSKSTDTLNQIAKDITTEGQIETLIKAKGFPDCVCIISDGSASVVVKPKTSTTLSANDTAQIYDIVLTQTKFAKTSIKIIPEN
jgi:stage III sporulation protein AH